MTCPYCGRPEVYRKDLPDNKCPGCGTVVAHDGCAYSFHRCHSRRCKPAELCPAGGRVFRSTYGGHHHMEAPA